MNVDKPTSDTPIYDSLITEKEQQFLENRAMHSVVPSLSAQALVEPVVLPVETVLVKKPKLVSLAGYSMGAQHVAHTINTAIENGEFDVMGSTFVKYVDENKRFITAHEFSRLAREVRGL